MTKTELTKADVRNEPYIDVHLHTCLLSGILKDYLRELPSQLITKTLYQVVEEAMTLRPPPAPPAGVDPQLALSTMELLSCLPPPERVTTSQAALLKCYSLLQCRTTSAQCFPKGSTLTNLSLAFHPYCNIYTRRKVSHLNKIYIETLGRISQLAVPLYCNIFSCFY